MANNCLVNSDEQIDLTLANYDGQRHLVTTTVPAGERRIIEAVQSVRAGDEIGFPVLVTTIGWFESNPGAVWERIWLDANPCSPSRVASGIGWRIFATNSSCCAVGACARHVNDVYHRWISNRAQPWSQMAGKREKVRPHGDGRLQVIWRPRPPCLQSRVHWCRLRIRSAGQSRPKGKWNARNVCGL